CFSMYFSTYSEKRGQIYLLLRCDQDGPLLLYPHWSDSWISSQSPATMVSSIQAAYLLCSFCLTVGKAKGAVAGSSAVNGIREETACLSSINKSVPLFPHLFTKKGSLLAHGSDLRQDMLPQAD
ncbi:MAG: hypothetical protein WCP58_10165, partial [bacterium]